MGWDLTVLNIANGPETLEQVQDDAVLPLGSREYVASIIQKTFPDADITDPSWLVVTRQRYSIEFDIGKNNTVEYLTIHIHGDIESVDAISLLARTSGWSFLDASIGNLIDFKKDDTADGFLRWQQYKSEIFRGK